MSGWWHQPPAAPLGLSIADSRRLFDAHHSTGGCWWTTCYMLRPATTWPPLGEAHAEALVEWGEGVRLHPLPFRRPAYSRIVVGPTRHEGGW